VDANLKKEKFPSFTQSKRGTVLGFGKGKQQSPSGPEVLGQRPSLIQSRRRGTRRNIDAWGLPIGEWKERGCRGEHGWQWVQLYYSKNGVEDVREIARQIKGRVLTSVT